jgi:sterol 3beta-glucosyltransferase
MPLMGFPDMSLPRYNKMTYHLGEKILWWMFRSVINQWRTQTLHLPPVPAKGYFDQLGTRKFPILNGFSRHVVPRPADWSEHIHITGYWFPEHKQWEAPKNLMDFMDAGTAPVFIGFGSMPIKNPGRTTEIILEALRRSGQRGILHSGWGKLGEAPLPDHVFKIDYAPYSWLFPRMTMIVHHGGSGTTAFGLRSGKPACVVPFVFDQFYWGKRIAKLGVGPTPISFKRLTVGNLQQAIETGIHDQRVRQNASELGERIRAENGVQVAMDIIEGMPSVLSRSLRM